jgi:histone deacetylase 1/2
VAVMVAFGHGYKGSHGGNHALGGASSCAIYQLCGKEGHNVVRCFKRFDASFIGPPQKSASSTTTSYGVDTNWYMDFSATYHIMSELEKLTMRDKYHGGDQVHAANGSGMEILHVGHSTLHSPTNKIHLWNIHHVPNESKSLVSVNRITHDNNAFVEFHPNHFSIKDQATRRTILIGTCEGGLYHLKSSSLRLSQK